MDDKDFLILPESKFLDVINPQSNKPRSKSNRLSCLTTIVTICFVCLLCVAGLLVVWIQTGCWKKTTNILDTPLYDAPHCSPAPYTNRFNCWPEEKNATQDKCVARGCCWAPVYDSNRLTDVPWCFYPNDFQLYTVQSLQKTSTGMTAQLVSNVKSGWPNDIVQLRLDIVFETYTRLHFKIYDPNNKRYEVPVNVSTVDNPVSDTDYIVDVPTKGPFYITVTRKSTGKILFSSKSVAPLVFADQFLQFGTQLSSQYIYGLGERMDKFAISTKWNKFVLWSRDHPPQLKGNLYGVHPFYLNIEEDHNAHGVFFLNSNAMEIELQEAPALTYRTTGGVLDFYILTGPSPDSVVEQYTGLIGRPFMPPYWALGFHLCRWGYKTSADLKKVIDRMRAAKMPYDTQWNDIDYMRTKLDWTYDKHGRYPDLPDIVQDLHDQGQHYIPLVDPGLSNKQPNGSYPPYDDGLKQGIFIMKHDGSGPSIGTSWPGTVALPDFFHPNGTKFWIEHARSYHNQVPFDGLWIDENEPSCGNVENCTDKKFDNPPFIPVGIVGGSLNSDTLCASSKQYISEFYNLHSLYGHSEAIASKSALDTLRPNRRTLVISRSTYPTTGVHAGHWLGDNNAEWDHIYYSITGVLSYQLFGISMVGADICGFFGDTTPKLCARWMQAGAFYPFMRNHNEVGHKDQDPAIFDSQTQDIMRDALITRYTLLPFLYTLFYKSHINGTAIVRPMFFQYPESEDNFIYNEDAQFLWGTGLLITPALAENTLRDRGYLPKDRWYNYYTYTYVDSPGEYVMFDLPMERINIQVKGGSVIPMQHPAVTTTLARKNPFRLLVALSPTSTAYGELYWDDGDSADSISTGKYNFISFQASEQTLSSTVHMSGYTNEKMILGDVRIMGVETVPKTVTIDGQTVPTFTYLDKCLYIDKQNINLLKQFKIKWQP